MSYLFAVAGEIKLSEAVSGMGFVVHIGMLYKFLFFRQT
jgi:hypothetical protein